MLEKTGNFNKEVISIKNRKMEMLEIKNAMMNDALCKLISSFHRTETRISKFEEIQRKK